MKKQKLQLIILLALLVVFVCGYFGLQKYNKDAAAKESEPTYIALSLGDDADVTKMHVTNTNGDFTLEKSDGETWSLKEDSTVDIDESKITTKLNSLKSITSDQVVEDYSDLADFGLATPAETVEITLSTGDTHTIKIGDYNNTVNKYYILVDDNTTIYTVNSIIKTNFGFSVDDITTTAEEDTTAE
jgi:hypothetical protein